MESGGFFEPLMTFVDSLVQQRFLRTEHRDMLVVGQDVSVLLERMSAYVPVVVPKWINRDQT